MSSFRHFLPLRKRCGSAITYTLLMVLSAERLNDASTKLRGNLRHRGRSGVGLLG